MAPWSLNVKIVTMNAHKSGTFYAKLFSLKTDFRYDKYQSQSYLNSKVHIYKSLTLITFDQTIEGAIEFSLEL